MPRAKSVVKVILCVIAVFGVNIITGFAAALAFLLYLVRDDLILAAVPALFALPAVVLQPWSIVMIFVARSMFVAPLTTVVTILVYGWLNWSGRLDRAKSFLASFKMRTMFATAVGLILLAAAVAVARYKDFPALHHGLPPSVECLGLSVSDSRYYCLGRFVDSAWVWQARLTESELARLTTRFGLRAVDRSEIPDEFRRMPPYWWHPSIDGRTTVLTTPGFPLNERGPDGWFAVATWNPDDQVLHVWIKNNF
ncbi:MAG TPA: hypothetical protein VLM38_06875 [Blastocatellia bacterium]|nr:hypothetical protein [Blastocatellia bacterium]